MTFSNGRSLAMAVLLFGVGCTGDDTGPPAEPTAGDAETDTESETDSTTPGTATETNDTDDTTGGDDEEIELSQGQFKDPDGAWNPIENGDTLVMELGGQGSYMFAMPIRLYGIEVPDEPSDWQDEKAPKVDLYMTVPGYNNGPGDYFQRVVNYRIPLTAVEDEEDAWEFHYITVFIPTDPEDLPEVSDIHGLAAHIDLEVETWNHGLDTGSGFTRSYDLVIDVPF